MSGNIYTEALLDIAPDLDGDHQVEPTVLVLGTPPTYEDKIPDDYGDHIPGKQVGCYKGVPVVQFSPRIATVSDDRNGLVLSDGHLGSGPTDLPAEFDHVISRDDYVAAVIYQEADDEGTYDEVRVEDVGHQDEP